MREPNRLIGGCHLKWNRLTGKCMAHFPIRESWTFPPAQTQPHLERRCQTAIRQLDRRNRSPPPRGI
jgi:hypothetical protein